MQPLRAGSWLMWKHSVRRGGQLGTGRQDYAPLTVVFSVSTLCSLRSSCRVNLSPASGCSVGVNACDRFAKNPAMTTSAPGTPPIQDASPHKVSCGRYSLMLFLIITIAMEHALMLFWCAHSLVSLSLGRPGQRS